MLHAPTGKQAQLTYKLIFKHIIVINIRSNILFILLFYGMKIINSVDEMTKTEVKMKLVRLDSLFHI